MGRKSNWSLEQQLLNGRTIEPVTNCWLWRQKSKRTGYGKLTLNYKTVNVHRASAHVHFGLDLDDGRLVLHKCRNKHCFNPDHLYIGSQSDNIKDSVKDGTHHGVSKTHCPRGHKYSEENTYNCHGHRYCKPCRQSYMREYYKRRKQVA